MPALMLDDDALVVTRCDIYDEAASNFRPFRWSACLMDARTGDAMARSEGIAATAREGWDAAGSAGVALARRYRAGEWEGVSNEPF